MTNDDQDDRRVRRTRGAVFEAFRELVLARRYTEIAVGDVIEAAGVGRSTFYEHFRNKDDVLLQSIEPLFEPLADTACGKPDPDHIEFVIDHLWEQRSLARIILRDALLEKLTRKLTDMIEARSTSAEGAKRRLVAIASASALLGILRAWLVGEFAMKHETLAARIMCLFADNSTDPWDKCTHSGAY